MSETAIALRPHGLTTEQVDRQVAARTSTTAAGCMEFSGHLNHGGYGVVKIAGRTMLAHRAVWVAARGAVPDGMEVCHRCDNRRCVSLTHLFVGTRMENVRDMMQKGRGRKARGEGHWRARMTERLVARMRQERAAGATLATLVARYQMSKSAVHQIVTGKNWRTP
jgi:hypothetical protein